MPRPRTRGEIAAEGLFNRTPKKAAGTPTFVAPPPPPKTSSQKTAFKEFINAHPAMRGYEIPIWNWAKTYGVDPLVMASLFWLESFAEAKRLGKDPTTIESYAGAVGIGQMHRGTWLGKKAPWGATISEEFMANPETNIRWSTWYFAENLKKHGPNPDDAYSKGYNSGYPEGTKAITSLLPKGYVLEGGLSLGQEASVSAEKSVLTEQAKQLLTDPWVTIDRRGKIQTVKGEVAPKNALKWGGTRPLTLSEFNHLWKQSYADTFFTHTGRQATGREIQQILEDTPSVFTLATQLGGRKEFAKSPLYRAKGPGISEYIKGKLGHRPSVKQIGQMITEQWDPATVDAWVRGQPSYVKGPEYRNNVATHTNVFTKIMGKPDAVGKQFIHKAAVGGWEEDALAARLRNDPAYQYSPEYQTKTVNMLDQLGLLIGARPVLKTAIPKKVSSGGLSSGIPTYTATLERPT